MNWPVATPAAPYYAVIFSAAFAGTPDGDYAQTAARLGAAAAGREGFLGMESVQENGREITVSYWRDLDAIRAWKADLDHLDAQRQGRERWYARYSVRVARVELAYEFG